MSEPIVTLNPSAAQYEIHVDGTLAGIARIRESDDEVVFTHTEVFDEFGGQGLAHVLAAAALADVAQRGKTVVPICPFIASYLTKHPEAAPSVRWPNAAS